MWCKYMFSTRRVSRFRSVNRPQPKSKASPEPPKRKPRRGPRANFLGKGKLYLRAPKIGWARKSQLEMQARRVGPESGARDFSWPGEFGCCLASCVCSRGRVNVAFFGGVADGFW